MNPKLIQGFRATARCLHHSRALGRLFNILAWFEYARQDAGESEKLVRGLIANGCTSTASPRPVDPTLNVCPSRSIVPSLP